MRSRYSSCACASAAEARSTASCEASIAAAVAACHGGASPRAEAPAPTATAEGSLPAGLRAGPHELVVDSTTLWYRVGGVAATEVPPVVFLHGGPGQGSEHFDALAGPFLERTLRMVYFDQRGSGRSGKPASGDYGIPTLVADVEALRQALGVPRITVMGHSFGAVLALEYAARYPEHTASVIVVAGAWDMPYQCRLRLRTLAERRPALWERVRGDTIDAQGARRHDCELELAAFPSGEEREAYNLETMFPNPAVSRRMDSVNVAQGIRNTGEMGRALFRGGLLQYRFTGFDRVRAPVLVIAGRRDGAARPEGLRELALRLPRGRFLELEKSGHFVYLDEPERFAREVTAFLADSSGSPEALPAMTVDVDHVIVAIDSLERGMALLREKTGVSPIIGGAHPGRGTQNALMSLGPRVYLELLAPNPADSAGARVVAEHARYTSLTPVGWAVHASDVGIVRASAIARGLPPSEIRAGSRRKPDGAELAWRTLAPWGAEDLGVLPFFIEWSAASPHPATTTPTGCTLAALTIETPAPDSLRALLGRASLDVPVSAGSDERLRVALDCPTGRVHLP